MIPSDRNWQWSSFGKHPAVKDYFKMGQNKEIEKQFKEFQLIWQVTKSNNIA